MRARFLTLSGAKIAACSDIPRLSWLEFYENLGREISRGVRLASLFDCSLGGDESSVLALFLNEEESSASLVAMPLLPSYPSLTARFPQAHWFERELAENCGVRPEGHPWLKPVRFSGSGRIGLTDFFEVKGDEVHEVAVGPVHAGIIEPGHFRFQCHGEKVFHLEISLGYQHRGVERALRGGPDVRTRFYMETLAGDTTAGHALAHAELIEMLSGIEAPLRAQSLRGILLELERLANHAGDLGALAGDVGYLPTASFCGRIRGDILNMTALIAGNRFSRGAIRPGGILHDLGDRERLELERQMKKTMHDLKIAVDLLFESSLVLARFEDAGTVSRATSETLGLVGPAARSCGIETDIRQRYPSGIYRFFNVPVSTWPSGDVFARAYLRWIEAQRSAEFILEQIQVFPSGPLYIPPGPLRGETAAFTLTEGWRGEICHAAVTDRKGKFLRYKVVDPSFHNWMGLAMAMRNQPISDFPLCNKSFNLSYCGHDL